MQVDLLHNNRKKFRISEIPLLVDRCTDPIEESERTPWDRPSAKFQSLMFGVKWEYGSTDSSLQDQ
jgi:hypothetical protein